MFDADDIDYLVKHFDVSDLRHEIKNARYKAYAEYEPQRLEFWEEFISACKTAIYIIGEPVKYNTKGDPLESIESIKSRVDLVDYIGQYVKLRQSGERFSGLCPFHNDKKSASFFVYPDGNFHCFGCQAHGSIIDFVMKYENLDLKSAISKLSR
jgi:hypothetical protein